MKSGDLPIYKSSEISLLDINDLIDRGTRFHVGFNLPEERYAKLSDVKRSSHSDQQKSKVGRF